MKKHIVTALLVGVLIGVGICYGYSRYLDIRETASSPHVQVGTFYYVWYDPKVATSWEYPKICDKPISDYYNSSDPEVIKQHCYWLSNLEINFAIVSWWGLYNQNQLNFPFADEATHQVFKIAKENVTNVKFCVMVEPFGSPPFNETDNPTYDYSEIYDYVYDNFVNQYSTVYYEYQEKPLICFFNDPFLTPSNGNIPKDDRFTVIIVGGDSYADWIYSDLVKEWVTDPAVRNRQVSVTPRFDDSRFRTPSHVIDKNLCEGIYDKQWETAIELARQNAIDVITICSWNEYPERTAIEPHWDADAYDHNSYFLYNKTKKYIAELKP